MSAVDPLTRQQVEALLLTMGRVAGTSLMGTVRVAGAIIRAEQMTI